MGALSDSFATQIKAQGLKYDKKQVETYQSHLHSILTLRFAGLLTDSMYDNINKKLFKQIQAHVMKENKLKHPKPAKP